MFGFFNKKNKLLNFDTEFFDDIKITQYSDKLIDNINEDKEVNKEKKHTRIKGSRYMYGLFFIFAVLIFYFIYSLLRSLFMGNINYDIYEVTSGQIIKYNIERGFIIRDETVYNAKENGYINFLCLSNTRTNKGNLIYVINDNDNLNMKKNLLNEDDYTKIASNIKKYVNTDFKINFYNLPNYIKTLQSFIKELSNISNLTNIMNQGSMKVNFAGFSEKSGIISYAIDGYEDLMENNFNSNLLNNVYNIHMTNQNEAVNIGDKIFKIIDNPEYNIIFESKNDYSSVLNKNVRVSFQNEDIEINGQITEFTASNHKKYYKLTINKFLEYFLDRRIVEFEVLNDSKRGLKIPISSIVEKNCFKLPKDFMFYDDEMGEDYILKNVNGNESEKFYVNVSKVDDEYYYIPVDNINNIKFGDVILNNQSDYFTLNDVVKVLGVYNANKGYAQLRNIDIIDRNSDFAIISKDTRRGIEVYDRIVLNANNIKDGDLIS